VPCGQSCVDTAKDRDNCGACGLACGAGEVCNAGVCTSTCTSNEPLCVLDGGAAYCAQTSSDNANCGACFVVCATGRVCADGICATTCASDQDYCANNGAPYCANTTSDNANCGSCGNACPSGEICKGGSCSTPCTTAQTFCSSNGGYCATTQSDPLNCGGCGVLCGSHQICTGAACVCAPTYSSCFGQCANLASDNSNCGSCGVTCSGTCEAGRCVVTLASGQSFPFGIVLGSSNLYWANEGNALVQSVPMGGGSVTTLTTLTNEHPEFVALDSTNAYVTANSLYAVPLVGGSGTVLASGYGTVMGVRVDSTYAYFTAGALPGGVYRVSKVGGTVETLATSSRPYDLAIDATYVYWTDLTDGTLSRAPLSGGTVDVLASGANAGAHLTIDATNAYWIDAGPVGAKVMQTPLAGGTSTVLFSSFQYTALAIAVDNTHVFWANQNSDVMSIPIGGGTSTALTSGEVTWDGIALDAKSVYFVTSQAVKKVTPKK